MLFCKVALFLSCLLLHWSYVDPEEYRKLRPINDMSFLLQHVRINFQFRYREDLRFSVHHEMFAQAGLIWILNSVTQIN